MIKRSNILKLSRTAAAVVLCSASSQTATAGNRRYAATIVLVAAVLLAGPVAAPAQAGSPLRWELEGKFSLLASIDATVDGTRYREQHDWTVRLPKLEGVHFFGPGTAPVELKDSTIKGSVEWTREGWQTSEAGFRGKGDVRVRLAYAGLSGGLPMVSVTLLPASGRSAGLPGPTGTERAERHTPALAFLVAAGASASANMELRSADGKLLTTEAPVTSELVMLQTDIVRLHGFGKIGPSPRCSYRECDIRRDISRPLTLIATPQGSPGVWSFGSWRGCDSRSGVSCTLSGVEPRRAAVTFVESPCSAAIPRANRSVVVSVDVACSRSDLVYGWLYVREAVARRAGIENSAVEGLVLVGSRQSHGRTKTIEIALGEFNRQALRQAGYRRIKIRVRVQIQNRGLPREILWRWVTVKLDRAE